MLPRGRFLLAQCSSGPIDSVPNPPMLQLVQEIQLSHTFSNRMGSKMGSKIRLSRNNSAIREAKHLPVSDEKTSATTFTTPQLLALPKNPKPRQRQRKCEFMNKKQLSNKPELRLDQCLTSWDPKIPPKLTKSYLQSDLQRRPNRCSLGATTLSN